MLPITPDPIRPSRRQFLIGAGAAGAGLTIAFHVPLARAPLAAEAAANPFNAYLRIAPDGTVTVLSAHMDMGQGIYNGIATLVAEELDAEWAQIRVEGIAGNPQLYGNLAWGGAVQGTGGSTGIRSSFERYRRAGAMARAMLIEAAAREWGVPASEIRVEKGIVSHASGKRASFGELADAAAKVASPAELKLKNPKDFAYIGNPELPRLDSKAKTTGRQEFTIDVRLPGMLTAVVAHPPLFDATVRSFDPSRALAVEGVVHVVQIARGVAVVAAHTWAALKGREALVIEWDDGAAEKRGTKELLAEYWALAGTPGAAIARNDGDAEGEIAAAARVLEADFEFPYLAHAAMEPLDAVAWMHDGVLEVYGGHQIPDLYQAVAAEIAGIDPAKVQLRVMMTGGGFGRRAVGDADIIVEAVSTAKAIGWRAPVKVLWTREDDMTGGRYRPMYVHRLKAGLDEDGHLVGWRHRIVGQSILRGTPFEGFIKDGVDGSSVEGAANLPYAIANLLVDLHTTDVGVPVLWWRSVGSTHTAYASEVFLDEVAHAAGQDPVELRRALLQNQPRHLGVLNLAAEKAQWGSPLPRGRGRGIAVHKSFDTYVAQVAEVAVDEGGQLKVERVVCAVDCGVAVNPDVIRAQMEGGIGFGLSAILHGELTLDDGRVEQTNYDTFRVLTIDEMPDVEVYIVPSEAAPTGVGEPGVPPIGPAVANAIFAATGKRIRTLPLAKHDLMRA
jgi:isoquinoline 1-oxidoreductase beta subunit